MGFLKNLPRIRFQPLNFFLRSFLENGCIKLIELILFYNSHLLKIGPENEEEEDEKANKTGERSGKRSRTRGRDDEEEEE